MRWRGVGILLKKDLVQHFRNQMITAVSLLFMVLFLAVYFLMPKTMEDDFTLGVAGDEIPGLLTYLAGEDDGFNIIRAADEDELTALINDKKCQAGYLFPPGWHEALQGGENPETGVYYPSDSPPELISLLTMIAGEAAWAAEGVSLLHVEWDEEVLGHDLTGAQIPYRERMRSLIVLFGLATEIFGLAALINRELALRTADALLVTPLGVPEIFLAKGLLGTLMAFIQAAFMMAVIGGMHNHPLLIIVFIFSGAVMTTAMSFIIGSLGKDFLSTMIWGIPLMILLILPGMAAIIPGAAAEWIKAVPSYFLVESLFKISQFDAGWGENLTNLFILTIVNVCLILIGILVLKRRFR